MIDVKQNKDKRTLKDYARLSIAFLFGLVVLSVYQQIRLLLDGVIDDLVSKSFFILLLNHIGFASLLCLVLVFFFKALEAKKPGKGFKLVLFLFVLFLIGETLLVEYYILHYELVSTDLFVLMRASNLSLVTLFGSIVTLIGVLGIYYLGYRMSSKFYGFVGKMYPFTIILFAMFIGTLFTEKRPMNQNKTQFLIYTSVTEVMNFNEYDGPEKYPWLNKEKVETDFAEYFNFKNEKPNLVFIMVEGLGSEFIGKGSKYASFMPFLDSLSQNSLVWNNYLSNSGEHGASIPSLLGSLPFGKNGFSNLDRPINRNTLLSILKNNGYRTAFFYGGNSSLESLDRFMEEERIDDIFEKSRFGDDYVAQREDRAGFSLGYPDKALFKKWEESYLPLGTPKLDFFLTLSTKSPFAIPQNKSYLDKVDKIIARSTYSHKKLKVLENNSALFAAFNYTDDAIKTFFKKYRSKKEFNNTVFIITGNESAEGLPKTTNLEKYRVPLIIYSPLLRTKEQFKNPSSHLDVAPTFLAVLAARHNLQMPAQTAWLGGDLLGTKKKGIPLFRNKNNISDFVWSNTFYTNGRVYQIHQGILSGVQENDTIRKEITDRYRRFKSINDYVTTNNTLIPDSVAIHNLGKYEFSKKELVWINSVFTGKNYDNAYETAKKLAHDGALEKSILLCDYLLSNVPNHIDAKILKGRIFAWKKQYARSQDILENAVAKFPHYEDAYAALLDLYFWSNKNNLALNVSKKLEENNIKSKELDKKLQRCLRLLSSEQAHKF